LVFSSGIGEDLTIQSLHWDQVWNLKTNSWMKESANFINAWVTSNIPSTKGMCDHQLTRSNYFKTMQVLNPIVKKRFVCEKKVHFEHFCYKKLGLSGQLGENCLFDLCNGMSEEQVYQIFKKKILNIKKTNLL